MRIKEKACPAEGAKVPDGMKAPACGMSENRNRLQFCLRCGGRIGADKNVITTEDRFAYRLRICASCGARHRTKQGPEEFCGVEE